MLRFFLIEIVVQERAKEKNVYISEVRREYVEKVKSYCKGVFCFEYIWPKNNESGRYLICTESDEEPPKSFGAVLEWIEKNRIEYFSNGE